MSDIIFYVEEYPDFDPSEDDAEDTLADIDPEKSSRKVEISGATRLIGKLADDRFDVKEYELSLDVPDGYVLKIHEEGETGLLAIRKTQR